MRVGFSDSPPSWRLQPCCMCLMEEPVLRGPNITETNLSHFGETTYTQFRIYGPHLSGLVHISEKSIKAKDVLGKTFSKKPYTPDFGYMDHICPLCNGSNGTIYWGKIPYNRKITEKVHISKVHISGIGCNGKITKKTYSVNWL